MAEIVTMALFCAALVSCIAAGISIVPALAVGVLIFLVHGRLTGHAWKPMLRGGFATMKAASIVVVTFVLIGLLTTVWRAAGTVPFIVTNATALVRPHVVILLTFLLNCLMSLLTGSSFASAATMGVITMTLGTSMQVSPMFLGGAILSGVYFGDRCSPVSTSAQLVKTLTHTNIFENIRLMLRTAAIPFVLTCVVYASLALCTRPSAGSVDVAALFGGAFNLHWVTVLPAVVLIVLAVARVDVRLTMGASICTALPICLFVQHMDWLSVARALVFGYHCTDSRVAPLIDGGGIVSMIKVMLIVCISSSYSGIFQETGLLRGAHLLVRRIADRIGGFGATFVTSMVTGCVACNQTLSIMLTDQLCREVEPDEHRHAINLEDTAVVVAPLIPWSIAGAVPLASVGAPTVSLLFACFLYLLPITGLLAASLPLPCRTAIRGNMAEGGIVRRRRTPLRRQST
ncbi:Na+/H+ antiporter NhaC family protein [Bifidobacterium moukalabense]|uniref:Sodium:proton antiporter n=1 Tax=Bifidobacterium moukalabense DSM 27321 TaxID=1435051 RepID=W4N9U0_9BIFI|nr:Na+/H+ antiporter NhaC family protein [Bifidobacterium moukalabense]ETY71266.1 sodium:proton antiporter [Bifidobacterium moukalabense DSM 27321]